MKRAQHRASGNGTARRARLAVVGAALLALLFTAGTFVAPLLMASGSPWGGVLRISYAPVCHQQVDRSLRVGEGFQAVCARCSGLYLGGVAGLFAGALFLVRRRSAPRPLWLAVIALPTLFDALLPWVGLPGLPNTLRLLLAWPVGLVTALFVARGIEELVAPRRIPADTASPTLDELDVNWLANRSGRESVEVVDG